MPAAPPLTSLGSRNRSPTFSAAALTSGELNFSSLVTHLS